MRSVYGRHGEIWFYDNDEYVGRSLYNYGEFSKDECKKILELANKSKDPHGICLDIGANVGVIAQMLDKDGFNVIAFEPQRAIYALLEKNFSGMCYNVALGESRDTTIMPAFDYEQKGNYSDVACDTRNDRGYVKVPIRTLDSFDIKNVCFIKMDVEGFELKVLRGGLTTIKRDKPIMYIEDAHASNSSKLRSFIQSLGYTIEEHSPKLFSEDNYFHSKKNIWEGVHVRRNIICRPC